MGINSSGDSKFGGEPAGNRGKDDPGSFGPGAPDDLVTLRAIIDCITEGVVVCDRDGKFILWNPAGEKLAGVGRTDALPEEWTDRYGVFLPDMKTPCPTERLPLVRAMAGESISEDELFIRNPGIPEGRFIRVNAGPLINAQGQLVGGVAVFRDVSEQKAAEVKVSLLNADLERRVEELAGANAELALLAEELACARDQALDLSKLKSQFVANISHELRTPLSAVIGLADMLLDTALAPPQQHLAIQAREAASGLLMIVNDLLDFSKIESGRMKIERSPFQLHELLQETVQAVAAEASEKGLLLKIDVDAQLPETVSGDAARLQQILLNLVANGVKFTERGGVQVIARPVPPGNDAYRLRVEVRDSGVGVSPEVTQGLFQPFVQADGGTNRKHGGTGLGLAICKRLLDLMGGEIGLESQVGVGTCFWFELPLSACVPGARAERISGGKQAIPSNGEPAGDVRAFVLVVEDNLVLQSLAAHQLDRLGLAASAVANGREAVEALTQRDYAFVLMDVQMPEMDGCEATLAIREEENKRGKHTPIIAMTASAMPEDRQRCLEAGMDDYVAKPVTIDELRRVIERWGVICRDE